MDINYLAVAENYPDLHNCSVTVIGLGYVGLPLAVEFAKEKNVMLPENSYQEKLLDLIPT